MPFQSWWGATRRRTRHSTTSLSAVSESSTGSATRSIWFGLVRAPAAEDLLIIDLVDDLTSDSMQSVDQLLAVCSVLGVHDREMVESVRSLRDAFDIRNRVIHEMDINFAATNRNRTSRTRASMVRETNRVLEVTRTIVEAVDELLSEA